ncbi:hypothetical protein CHLRE_14g609850v5 [Chlamydomonas reinhardtii]|uniref:Pherophorin domain-containing protein n=1 Tax=Chlamydomonas reinhardtii TaxID=3055 RepID=A0A2K3CX54_CHLRE|nr:uncharacterized protein CHLRE_14g609850v5 [Chlamydomonas reinhardtii]PNW72872.1 hypothetical protein CHLRE_14g609850v5 [Chlamydomonas reinhardtii]
MAPGMMISFVALATLLAWRGAEAYPRFWYDSDYLIAYGYGPDAGYDWSVFPERNCFNYPTTAYTGFYPAHSSPYTDSSIGLAFALSDGSAVTALCPGATHTVTLSFPNPRLALLTTNPPVTFTSPKPATSDCPGRVDLGGSSDANEATSFDGTFTVPCSAQGSSVVFAVTSAGTSARRWAQAQATLAVADAASAQCAAVSTTCVAAVPDPSPVAEPSPEPAVEPSPEPEPSPSPAPEPEPSPSPAPESQPEPSPAPKPQPAPSPASSSSPSSASPSKSSKPAPPPRRQPSKLHTAGGRRHPPPTRRPPPRRG